MAPPLEMYAFGTEHPDVAYVDLQYGFHYGFYNSVTTLPGVVTDSGSHDLSNNGAALDPATFYGGRADEGYYFCEEAVKHAETPQSFPDSGKLNSESITDSEPEYFPEGGCMSDTMLEEFIRGFIFNEPSTETELQDNGVHSSLSASPLDCVQASDSTLGQATMASSLEQGEDSAKDLNNSLEEITSRPATELLFPAIENHNSFVVSVASPRQAHRSMFKAVSKNEILRKRKRSSAKSNKFPAEIRISKKISKEGEYQKGKAWLGTFATSEQGRRALDVGRYFLNTKKKKIFFDPNSKEILSAFKDRLHALPLPELVETVIKMARRYGDTGSLPESLDDL